MPILLTRLPLNLSTGLLLAGLLCGPAPAGAAGDFLERDAVAADIGNRLRPEDKTGTPPRTQRSGDGNHLPPVDRLCMGDSPPGAAPAQEGDGPGGASCSGLSIELATPEGLELQLEKGSPTTEVTGPGPVHYEYFLLNSGALPLTGIEVADDHVDAPPLCPVTNLPPGASIICNATYTVTLADINAGGSPVPGSGFLQNNVAVVTLEGVSAAASLSIPFAVQVDPLVLFPAATSLGTAVQGIPRQFTFTAQGGLPPLQFSGSGAPAGMSFQQDATGLILSGAPQVTGDFVIGVAVADSSVPQNIVERNYSLRVVSRLVLSPPDGVPLPDAVPGQAYEFIFLISGGLAPYEFSAGGAPAGLSFALSGNQVILGGTSTQTGQFTIDLTVTDSSTPPQLVSGAYSLSVVPDLRLVPAGDAPLPDAVAGRPYEFVFTISGGVPPFEFSSGGAPAGMEITLGDEQLILSGTSTQTGQFTIDLTVTDSSTPPQLVAEAYSLRVVPELRLLPVEALLPDAQAGNSYQFVFTAEGGLAPVQLSGAGAPPGLQFEVLDGQLILGGIASEIGDYPITVSAQDSASPPQMITREYLLSVVLALELEPESLPEGTMGQDYLAVLSVRNGFPPFEIDIPDLPPGLGMNSNAITGRPSQAGTFPLTAFASDARGNSGSRDYVLQVGTSDDVAIGGTLPDAYLNTTYGYQLQAVAAPSPVTWSGGSGLPAGMELVSTGLVNGLAQETGAFSFEATASSADGQVRTGDFDILVRPPGLLSAEPDFPPGQTGFPYHSPTAVRGGLPPYDCAITGGSLPPGLVLAGCNDGIEGTPTAAGSFPFSLGVLDSSVPELAVELEALIQVAESTPIGEGLPPDLDYQPPLKVPVPELAVVRPDPSLPDESLQNLAVDPWGNRYLVGYSFNGSDYDLRVSKYSARGVLLWDQKYDSGSQDYGYGVTVAASDQAVYASGYSLAGNRYEAVLIRYDLVGVEQWVERIGGSSQVVALYGLAADEAAVYAVGERYNGTRFDALVLAYSHAGDLLWEAIRASQLTRTGYVAVRTDCDDLPCLLIGGAEGETNRTGWIERVAPATGAASSFALVPSAPVLALQASDAGIAAGGSTVNNDWLITVFDPAGQVDWSLTEASGHRLRGLALDRDGFLYAAGSGNAGADAMVALISPTGDVLGLSLFDDGAAESFHAVGIGPEGLVTAAGQRNAADGNRFLLVNFNTGKAR